MSPRDACDTQPLAVQTRARRDGPWPERTGPSQSCAIPVTLTFRSSYSFSASLQGLCAQV